MFRDANDEFMMSFEAGGEDNREETDHKDTIDLRASVGRNNLRKYVQNAGFNMVSEHSEEKSGYSGDNQLKVTLTPPIQKFNWL